MLVLFYCKFVDSWVQHNQKVNQFLTTLPHFNVKLHSFALEEEICCPSFIFTLITLRIIEWRTILEITAPSRKRILTERNRFNGLHCEVYCFSTATPYCYNSRWVLAALSSAAFRMRWYQFPLLTKLLGNQFSICFLNFQAVFVWVVILCFWLLCRCPSAWYYLSNKIRTVV